MKKIYNSALFILLSVSSAYVYAENMDQAMLLRSEKKYDQAIAVLTQMSTKGDYNPNIYSEIAMTYAWSGDMKKSLEMYDQIIQKNPEMNHFRVSRIWVLMWSQKYEVASREIKYLEGNKNGMLLERERAYLAMQTLDMKKSREIYQQILSKDENDSDALKNLQRIDAMSKGSLEISTGSNIMQSNLTQGYNVRLSYNINHMHSVSASLRKEVVSMVRRSRDVYEASYLLNAKKTVYGFSLGVDKRLSALGIQGSFLLSKKLNKDFFAGGEVSYALIDSGQGELLVRVDLGKQIRNISVVNQTFVFDGPYRSLVNVISASYKARENISIKNYAGYGWESDSDKMILGSTLQYKLKSKSSFFVDVQYINLQAPQWIISTGMKKGF